ncbi:hypothetical protein EIP91_011425 [Steccherinum ochraceum]|uniref:MYND-type domain-containing protein n=1 Tax=Steccherinum ochraceum TaxID=92696 RepID=A0A4R0RBD4_9APHY|nr:hypothetical protein EIP91_011425 [Steccherinum ochraceum]
MMSMMRKAQTQMQYKPGGLPPPEKQFMMALKARKAKQLAKVDLKDLDKHDVVMKVSLLLLNDSRGEPRIWRRFRVSAGIKLNVFQDKIIAPIMGWTRNLHCYHITDCRDGSMFGPESSSAVDETYRDTMGYDWLPDHKYQLAHIFDKEGDSISYTYDFGDKWFHRVTVEKILPLEESDGHVEVLEGRGMCPGENMQGCFAYREFLKNYDQAGLVERVPLKRQILACPNYTSLRKPPSLFDPDSFDMAFTKQNLTDALNSTNSLAKGAKKFTQPISSNAGTYSQPTNGQRVITHSQDSANASGGFWEEMQNEKDRRSAGVCAACGKPGGAELKRCAGCKQVLYCSPEHQKEHWKRVHKQTCSKEFTKK